ncbi:MAG TPA: 2-C-methyl-D-erythritol 4-phosphate cytidylyltransferase [Acidimicrobiia bacterium]
MAVIVLAAGGSTRMSNQANKAYLQLDGAPLVARSLRTLASDQSTVRMVLVIRPEERALAEAAVSAAGTGLEVELVEGGPTRQRSEWKGIKALAAEIEAGDLDLVAIHDAARPFFTRSLWDRLVAAAEETGGAVPALPVANLFTREGDMVGRPTPTEAARVQTPQVFRAVPLLGAYRVAGETAHDFDDTAQVVERFSSLVVAAVHGEEANRKITFASDLAPV